MADHPNCIDWHFGFLFMFFGYIVMVGVVWRVFNSLVERRTTV